MKTTRCLWMVLGFAILYIFEAYGSMPFQNALQRRIWKISPQSDAIELALISSYPNESGDGEHDLWLPLDLKGDSLGNSFIVDYKANSVLKYDNHSKLILKFGRLGQGIGDLSGPVKMRVFRDFLVIGESKTMRLQYFTHSGAPIRIVKLFKSIWGFDIDEQGRIFTNPMYTSSKSFNKNIHLVEIMSQDGTVSSTFGVPIASKWDDYILNRSMIHLGKPSELWWSSAISP